VLCSMSSLDMSGNFSTLHGVVNAPPGGAADTSPPILRWGCRLCLVWIAVLICRAISLDAAGE
jgi:hypothetical protein